MSCKAVESWESCAARTSRVGRVVVDEEEMVVVGVGVEAPFVVVAEALALAAEGTVCAS